MKLLTKELEKRFLEVGCQDDKGNDAIVICHYFIGSCDWYCTEYIPEDKVFFGFANLNDPEMAELGYISLSELESVNVRGFTIERDLYWKECSLGDVIRKVKGDM